MAYLTGTDEDDRIQATRGEDVVISLGGDDIVLAYGEPVGGGPYAAYRARAADRADLVFAGDGDDRIDAGGGADAIGGGTGDDVFVFGWLGGPFPEADTQAGRGGRDVVLDFEQGSDLIDLSGYENASAPGAVWLSTGEPTAGTKQLQVGYRTEGARTVVEFYAPTDEHPGRGAPRLTGEIELTGLHQLTEGDFIF